MWLITTFGFYSIVEKNDQRGSGNLTIRARVRADLEALRDKYLPDMGEIIETHNSDYRFRAVAKREAICAAFAAAMSDINYHNFKDEVARKQGRARSQIYHDVWSDLYKLQARG